MLNSPPAKAENSRATPYDVITNLGPPENACLNLVSVSLYIPAALKHHNGT